MRVLLRWVAGASALSAMLGLVIVSMGGHVSLAGLKAVAITVLVSVAISGPVAYWGLKLVLPPASGPRRVGGVVLFVLAVGVWCCITFAGHFLGALVEISSEEYRGPRTFSVSDWSTHETSRWYMAEELISKGTLLGLTEGQVMELLGPPIDERSAMFYGGSKLTYRLGMERNPLFGIDSEWLVARLSDEGRVVEVEIVRD